MPIDISIKRAPDDLVRLLKERARRNHRSMQREALAILEEAVQKPGPLTPLQLLAEVRRLEHEHAGRSRRNRSQNT